jgi:uncharacterized membrane protein
MPDPQSVFLVHLAATLFMSGLIWFVQVVHYPMFSAVGREQFAEYEVVHSRRTTWVVAPVMLVEAATGLILAVRPPLESLRGAMLAAGALLAAIWLSTAFLQVPRHRRLESGYDESTHRTLVSTNVIRTVAWSARSVILIVVTGWLMQKGGVAS